LCFGTIPTGMPVHIYRNSPDDGLAACVSFLKEGEFVSPWIDASKAGDGTWQLPQYPCEIKGLPADDPKQKEWTPGEYETGVDNVDLDPNNQIREWGGQKMWEGDRPPREWDLHAHPENVQALMQVPHMPGQPVKEMFARMKALDPRPFQDKYFDEILRDMLPEWPALFRHARYAESFGIHSVQAPAEWAEQTDELVPSVYPTPRPDAVTICVGLAGHDVSQSLLPADLPGAEYDCLELLYAKDQEGKLIQIVPFPNYGMTPTVFHAYSFIPPKGTSLIKPYACFKIRGVWSGAAIEWNPEVGSEDMQWFVDMEPGMRAQLADRSKLQTKSKSQIAAVRHSKGQKAKPVLWPENSWEGNAAKARTWDSRSCS